MHQFSWMMIVLACVVAFDGAVAEAQRLASRGTSNWLTWRGPNRDGVSLERGLMERWPANGPPRVWTTKGLGGGYSSVAIFGNGVATLGTDGGQTVLVVIDGRAGRIVNKTVIGPGGEPNATPTIDPSGRLIYGMSKKGDLACINTANGQVIWSKNMERDYGGRMMSSWGYSESPLIDGDKLVFTPGADDAGIVAVNKRTGRTIWQTKLPNLGGRGQPGAGYASIVISSGGGVRQYIQLMGRAVVGVNAETGQYLWHYDRVNNTTANIPTPIVHEDLVFVTTGYGDGGSALLKLSPDGSGGVKAEEVYYKPARELQNHHGGVIRVGDYIYGGHGHNRGYPFCLELATGRIVWKNEDRSLSRKESAAVAYADGHLYFRYQDGTMVLVEATPEGYREKGSFQIPDNSGPSWPHPVISKGRLYLRVADQLQCYRLR